MSSNSGPGFWPHLFTFWNALCCFFLARELLNTKKAQNTHFQNHNFLLVTQQLRQPRDAADTETTSSNNIVLTINKTLLFGRKLQESETRKPCCKRKPDKLKKPKSAEIPTVWRLTVDTQNQKQNGIRRLRNEALE